MKRTMKKYISILLSFFMLFQMFPVTGFGTGETTSNEGGLVTNYKVTASVDTDVSSIVNYSLTNEYNYYIVAFNGPTAYAVSTFNDVDFLDGSTQKSLNNINPLSFKVYKSLTNTKTVSGVTGSGIKTVLESSGYIGDIYFDWNATPNISGSTGTFEFHASRRKETVNVSFDTDPTSKGYWFLYASYSMDGVTYYRLSDPLSFTNNSATVTFEQLGTNGEKGTEGLANIPANADISFKLLNFKEQNNIIANKVIQEAVTQIGTSETYAAGYKFTYDNSTKTFNATQSNYQVEVNYSDSQNPSGNWCIYACYNDGTKAYYGYFTPSFSSGTATIDINSGSNRLSDQGDGNNGNYHYITPTDSIEVKLLHNPNNGNFKNSDGTISSEVNQITEGEKLKGYTYNYVTTGTMKTIITATKDTPYAYEVEVHDVDGSTITSGLTGTFNVVGWISRSTDGNNTTKYYQEKPIDLSNISTATKKLTGLFDGNYVSYGTATYYETGDTVETAIGTVSGNYDESNLYADGEILQIGSSLYQVHETKATGKSSIILKKLPDLKIKTVIGGTESGTLPTGYKLLISMTDGTGLTSYALTDLSTTAVSVPNFKAKKSGSYSEIHYYTGSENLTVELVKTSSSELSAVIGNSVCYNEGDMLPELYTFSTALNSETYLATTTLAPVSNNGVPHTINVSFYEKKEGTAYTAIPDDAKLNATDNFFFRIRLYRDKKVAAYAIVEAKITDGETQTGFAEFVNNHGAFSLEISKDQQFIQVDAQGNDISGAPTVHYDPATFDDIDVRFYKTINNASVPTTLNFQNAVDAIDGFDFWDNNTTLTEDKSAANTAIRLYSAYKKIYQVKVIVEDGTAINDSDKLYLNVLADHDTTDDQALTDYSWTSITPDSEDGAKVYTIVIENQTEQDNQSIWTTGKSNSISGNEDFTLYLKQDTINIANGCPVSLSAQSSNNYIAVYDTGKVENKNISYNSNDKVTTITHYVYIRPKTYEQAINPYSVLGAGAEYGVIAAHYIQNNHTETNFATHLYENPSAYPNEVDANGSLPIPFLIEAVGRGNLFLGASTKNNIDLYYSSDINITDKLKKDGNLSSEYAVNYISKDKDSVKTDVDNLIRKLQQSSSLYAGRSFYTPTGNNIDTTMFPDNVTIYIDGSNIDFSRAQYITKLEKQTLVFNIPGEDVVLNKSYTTVKRKDGDTLITLVNELNSNTSGNGGDADHNRNVEDHVLNHIVFNMYQATHVQLESGPAGLFLVPKSNAVIDKSGGSPTGWMATGGKFEQNDGEWHFFRTQRRYSGNSTTQGANKMIIIDGSEVVPSGTEQVFTFVRESLNFTTGIWEDRVEMSNTGSNISFPEINFSEPTDEGDHYYLIYEVQGDESNTDYTYDQTRYVVKSTVTLTGEDLLTCSVSNTYYKLDNNAALSEITESYEAEVHGITNGVPSTNTTTATRYRIKRNLLTQTVNNTESDVKFVNEKKNEQTGSLKITKAVRKNGSTDDTLSGEYTFTVNGPSSAAAENRVTKYVRINVTGGQPAQYKVADTETELATTSYTDGTTALISGLAAGEYTVVELSAGAMTLSSIVRGDSEAGNTATRSITLVVSAGVNDPANNSAAFVTFTNNKETTQISGTKTWVDQRQHNNNASEITLTLKRTTKPVSNTSVWDTVTVSSTTPERLTWTGNNYVFSNLDKYNANGIEYEYKVEESAVNVVDGSTAVPYKMETTATSSAENGYHFINTELTTVTARKTWNGSDSSWLSGMTVTFRLKQNGNAITTNALGQTISTQTVSNKDETASWANLPKYYINENTVTAYTYTVEETEVKYNNTAISNFRNVFTVTGEDNVTGTVVINNAMKTTSRNVTKTWIDGQDTTKRPDGITYTLSAVDSDDAPVTLSQYGVTGTLVGQKTNNYAVTWNSLPEYTYTGKAVTYSISEGAVSNYMQIGTATYTESTKTWNFQNKELGKVRVTKEVSGGVSLPANFQITAQYNDKNGTAQTKVLKITGGDINATGSGTASSPYVWEIGDLLLGTVVTFAEENNRVYGYDVSTTVTDAAGTRTAMTGTATVVNGSVSNVAFVNTYTEKKTNVSVQKVWSDGNSNHNSDSITINLLRNGTVVTGQSITLPRTENENKIWTYTWTDLDAEDSTGNEITYSVAEVTTNGQITAQNGFSYTPGQVAGGKDATTGNYSYTITNAKGGETTVSVRKAWFTTNSGTTEVAWPSGVTVEVTLYRNNTPYDTVKELTSGATVTWTGLPEKDGSGNTYNYTVAETKVKVLLPGAATATELSNYADLFGGSVTGSNNVYTVNNTIRKTTISGTKTWVDQRQHNNNASEITLTLKRTTKPVSNTSVWDTVTVSSTTPERLTWTGNNYVFSNLDKYNANGIEYEYKVEESAVNVVDGSTAVPYKMETTATSSAENGYHFINTELTTVTARKTWNGSDSSWLSGMTVTFRLKQNGNAITTNALGQTISTQTVSNKDETASWANLPKYYINENTVTAYTYTVEETEVKYNNTAISNFRNVFTVTGEDNVTGTVVINNAMKTTSRNVTKTWIDGQDTTKRPDGITYTLSAVDSDDAPVTLSQYGVTGTLVGQKTNNYAVTWNSLPEYTYTGKAVTYSISEGAVSNYMQIGTATYTESTKTWNFQNKELGKVRVTKEVSGGVSLPANFQITAQYNDKNGTAQTKVLKITGGDINATGSGTASSPYVWEIGDLLLGTVVTFAEENNRVYGYDVSTTVTDAAGTRTAMTGTATVVNGSVSNVAFVNTYTEKKTNVSVQKVWSDGNSNHNSDSITINLLRNGTVVTGQSITLPRTENENKIWTYTWTDLDAEDSTGNEITYSVAEVTTNGQITAQNGFSYTPGQVAGGKDATTGNYSYTITNAKGGETTVSVRKAWFTTNSGTTEVAWPSGVTVEVTLYRNNTPYDTVKELTSGATVTWTGLPEKDGSGNTYNYTVAETKVKVKQSGSDTAIELPNFKDLFGGSVTGTNNAYTVNNTIKTRDITVTKTWKPSWPDDVSEVRVVLKANGSKANVSDAEATLTDADASKTWSGLPVYDETGKEIVYSVEETSVKMNDVIYDSKSAVKLDELFKITANPVTVDSTGKVTLENEIRTTSLKVNKVWVFAEDSNIAQVDGTDGKWPKDGVVYVALYRTIDNVETEVDHIELTSSHTSHEFTNLPAHVGGKLATYTVKETGISKNIDSSKIAVSVDKNTNGDGYTITNREKQAGLTITKHVSGKNLTDAEKAGIVFTVKGEGLPANGVTKTLKDMGAGMTWTLTSKDGITSGKTYTVTESGAAIENYTKVTKTKANDGAEQTCADNENINATANVTVDASTGMGEVEIWNTYTQDVGAVSVTKVFTGTPVLPEGFRITNDYNNTIFIPENADSGDGLKTPFVWKIEDVPVGTVITFTESNTAIDGYTLSAATVTEKTCAAVTKGTTVTVAFTNDYTEDISYGAVEVTKAFTGTPVLPEGFRITNNYNNTIFTPETAESGDGLKTPFVWKIKDVPVGTVITFTESNTEIEGYILSAATVTEKTSAAVVKNDTVKVAFTNDYTEEISYGAVSVTKAFTGTPVLPEGFRITNDYDNSIFTPETAESGDGLTTPFVWKIDNVPVGTVITFTESNTAVDGYTLSEATVTEKTSAAVVKNDTVTVVFTNDYSRDMGSLQILKNVTVNGKATDGTLADGVYSFTVNSVSLDPAVSRTATVTITNGQVAGAGGDGVTMAEGDGKKYARMANLPTGDYTVAEALTEEQVKKGISLIRKSADEVTVIPDGTGEIPTVEFTNNIVTIKVQKMDILTDEELTGSHIQILDKDGNVVEEWDSDADAPHEVTGLKTGEEYTLRETVAPKGYDLTTDATFSVDENGKVTTTGYSATDGNGNTILLVKDAPLMTTVAVRKVWKDDNNRDGIRPLTLTVRLKANGEVIATRQLTEDNHWTLTEKGLRKYDVNGDEIVYTWEEIVPTGYTAESAKTTGMLTTLTNTHIAETTSVSVKKAWNDEGNKFRTRPESIRVQLFANGKAEGKAVILNEANGWSYSWNDLLKYENTSGRIGGSKEIVYTVTELSVPAGYTMSISGNAAKGFVITNSTDTGRGKMVIRKTFKIEEKEIEPELEDYTDIPVIKVWEDNNNRDGNRPESVTVILMRGGEEIDRATLTADSGWVHVFTHLPKYENNLTIRYSITEIPVEHYISSIDGYTITNKYMPTLTTASVRKVWDDHNNRDGMRPASIRMLLSNGMSVTLDESNGWSATITDLPAIVNGKPAEYTWTEEKTAGYTQVSKEKNGNVTTFTNRAIETPNPGKAKTGGNRWAIFEEYDTALGGQLLINHVGDCFD